MGVAEGFYKFQLTSPLLFLSRTHVKLIVIQFPAQSLLGLDFTAQVMQLKGTLTYRSMFNFLVNLLSALLAYSYQSKSRLWTSALKILASLPPAIFSPRRTHVKTNPPNSPNLKEIKGGSD